MKRHILFISLILFVIGSSYGQDILELPATTISTAVVIDSYDIVYINGNITIGIGGSLTIRPNANGLNASAGLPVHIAFSGSYRINIQGTGIFNVNGTSARNIIFTADWDKDQIYGESGEVWQNIFFFGSSGVSLIEYALIENGRGQSGFGGGISLIGKNITVRNTIVRNSTAPRGGGIYVSASGLVILENLNIYNNSVTAEGGGLYLKASTGFASAVSVTDCNIYSNDAPIGDGIFFYSPIIVNNCEIYSNSGDGVHVVSNANGAALRNCLIYGNTTGAYFATGTTGGSIVNCDIINNTTGVNSASSTAPVLLNTVLWGNTTQYTGTNIALANCGIQGGFTGGTDGGGNLPLSSTNTADNGPNFKDTSSPDYDINSWITPLLDGGAASYAGVSAPSADIEGRARISAIDIGAYEFLYYLWTGAVSTSWTESGNWTGSPATVPTLITENKVVIPAGISNYPVVQDLSLASRSRLELAPQSRLEVTGSTSVGTGCTFLIESDENGSAVFISGSSVTGTFNVEMYLAGGVGPNYPWHYVTTPVDGASTAVLTTNISNPYNLLAYDETEVTTDKNTGWEWADTYNGTTDGFSTLSNKKAYNVYVSTAQTATFTGTVSNNQNYSWINNELTVSGTVPEQAGWHLIGNPYTSGVDVEDFTLGADINKTIYYTQDNGYPTYNITTDEGLNGGTNTIAPLQGFFVHATSGTDKTLTIPASSRIDIPAPLYKGSGKVSDFPVLKVNISDGEAFTDEALVYFFKDAKSSFDNEYDAFKMLHRNPAHPQILTIADGMKLSMNGLPYPETKTIVPLNLRIGESKNYTINVLKLMNLDDYKVTLLHGDKMIDLRTNPAYSFYSAAGTVNNMSLVFENIISGVENPVQGKTYCWYSDGSVKIKSGIQGYEFNSSVNVYDINGKITFSKNNVSIVSGETVELPAQLPKGVYVISVSNKGLQFTKKLIITK